MALVVTLHTESRYLKPPLNILKSFSTRVVLTSHTCFHRTFSEYKKNTQDATQAEYYFNSF